LESGDAAEAVEQFERAANRGAPASRLAVPMATALTQINEPQRALATLDEVPADARDAPFWLARARALLAARAPDDAAEALRTAQQQGGDTSPLLVELARLAAVRGDTAEAEALLGRAVEADPTNAEAHVLLGTIVTQAGRLEQGAAQFAAAADLYTSRFQSVLAAPVLLRLVQVQLALNQIDAATATATRLSKAIPNAAFADYANGLVAFQRGDFAETIRLLRDAVSKAPGQSEFLALLGAAHLGAGNYGQAEQQFLAVLGANPADPAANRLLAETRIRQQRPRAALETLKFFEASDVEADLGLLLLQAAARLQSGDVEAALPYLEQAHGLSSGNQAVVLQLLQAYLALGRTADADALLRSSGALSADEAYSASLAVLIARLQGEGVDAARTYVAALANDQPDDPRPRMLAAVLEQVTGNEPSARANLEAAIALDGNFVPPRLALAALLAEEGRFADAERQLLAVTEADPENVDALMSLAQVAVRRADQGVAERYLQRAANISAASGPRLALARLYLVRGEIGLAEAEVGKVSQTEPATTDLLLTQGMLALAKNDPGTAVGLLRAAWQQSANRPSIALLYADAQVAAGDAAAARETLAAATQALPSVPELRAALGLAELRLGDSAEALRIAQGLQVEFGQRAIGFALEGRLRMVERRYAEAARAYTLAYERERNWELLTSVVAATRLLDPTSANAADPIREWLDAAPGDVNARLLLAEVLQGTGNVDEALREYASILALDPRNVVALNNAAWYAYELGRPEALDYARRAADLAPDSAPALDTLGWILVREDRAADALPYLTKAAQLAPQTLEIRYHLAVAQAGVGQRDAARETLRALLAESGAFELRGAAQELLRTL
jgi:putative PEP-CTERM system TPR-repeat lipoprotein